MPGSSSETPIPTGQLSGPARRAPAGAEYTSLEQLNETSEATVAELHGVGPTALETLRAALDTHGLSFKEAE